MRIIKAGNLPKDDMPQCTCLYQEAGALPESKLVVFTRTVEDPQCLIHTPRFTEADELLEPTGEVTE